VVADSESEVDEDSKCAADGEYGWLFSLNPSPHPHTATYPPICGCGLRREEGVRG
jgi:hypothetical protein